MLDFHEEDCVQLGEGEDIVLKTYSKYWSAIHHKDTFNDSTQNIIRAHVWIPDHLLSNRPQAFNAHICGRLYVPQRCRLTKDNAYDSDSDPNNEIHSENVIIDVVSVVMYPFNTNNITAVRKVFTSPIVNMIGVLSSDVGVHNENDKFRRVRFETGTALKDQNRYRTFPVSYVLHHNVAI